MSVRDPNGDRYYEMIENQLKFGLSLSDFSLLTEVCVQLCERAEEAKIGFSKLTSKWWEIHKQQMEKIYADEQKAKLRKQAEEEASEFLRKRLTELGIG